MHNNANIDRRGGLLGLAALISALILTLNVANAIEERSAIRSLATTKPAAIKNTEFGRDSSITVNRNRFA